MKFRTIILILCVVFISLYVMQEVNYFSMKALDEVDFNGSSLIIPKINLKENLNNESLTKGVLLDNTSKEPSKGKIVLHGHRTTLGSPFLRLNELKQGDNISINWPGIGKVNYIVDKSYIVDPDYRISLVNQTDTLYMVTCDPIGSTSRRLIVESSYLDTKPLDSTVNRMNYYMMMLLMLVGFFIIGFIVSYFYPVKEDRKFLFAIIVLITMILLGLVKHPISPDYFSFLANIG